MCADKAIEHAKNARHGKDTDERIAYLAAAVEELAKAIKALQPRS